MALLGNGTGFSGGLTPEILCDEVIVLHVTADANDIADGNVAELAVDVAYAKRRLKLPPFPKQLLRQTALRSCFAFAVAHFSLRTIAVSI